MVVLIFSDESNAGDRTFVITGAAGEGAEGAEAVQIGSGAFFTGIPIGDATLPPGTVFTAIDNTSANPISGTFAHLPDGGTIEIGSDTFQANYEGGDGNDLTLTVVQ